MKLVFVLVTLALSGAFIGCLFRSIYDPAGVLEWTVAFVFSLYVFSFAVDLYPAIRTRPGGQGYGERGRLRGDSAILPSTEDGGPPVLPQMRELGVTGSSAALADLGLGPSTGGLPSPGLGSGVQRMRADSAGSAVGGVGPGRHRMYGTGNYGSERTLTEPVGLPTQTTKGVRTPLDI